MLPWFQDSIIKYYSVQPTLCLCYFLSGIISLNLLLAVSVSQLVSVAEQTGLSLNWSEIPMTDFLTMRTKQVHVLGIQIRLAPGKSKLSYDFASWSEITPCNKIYKPLVVY